MPKSLQLRRYPTSTLATTTGLSGELIIDTTKNIITVHDGVTAGGWKTLSNTSSITTAGDFTVSGNLFVTGTSTTVNVNTVIVNQNEVIAGTLKANSGIISTSTTTGALQVSGGVGVTGSVYAANVIAGGVDVINYTNTANTWLQTHRVNINGDTLTGILNGPSFNGPIGNTTANTGSFTTLSASSTVSGTGFNSYLASPPAIGSTTAATGSFTTLSASSGISFSTVNSITALGTNQATATVLNGDTNIITTTAAGTGVILPTGIGREIAVINRGANALLVYPASGYTIDGATVNIATSVPPLGWLIVDCVSSSNYFAVDPVTVAGINTVITQTNNGTLTVAANTSSVTYEYCPTPTALTATATLTIAQMLSSIITVTSTAAVTLTLPIGSLTQNGVSSLMVGGMSFDWYVINIGSSAGAITIAVGTSHTYVGSVTVAITTTAHFRTQMVSSGVFVTYRLG